MEKVVLQRSGQRPLEFVGELVASYSSSPDRVHPNYSGSTGRWIVVQVYRTQAGQYVAWQARHSQWQDERDSFEARVVDTLEELFGHLEESHPRAAAAISEELGVHEVL